MDNGEKEKTPVKKLKRKEAGLCLLFRNACLVCERGRLDQDWHPHELLNRVYHGNEIGCGEIYDLEFLEWGIDQQSDSSLSEAASMLEGTFLAREEKKLLLEKIGTVAKERQRLLNQCTVSPFPSEQTIIQYLNEYYRLLKEAFRLRVSLKETGIWEKGFFEKILNLDCNEEEGYFWAEMYSPLVLESLRNIYDSLSEYKKIVQNLCFPAQASYYQEVFIRKILRSLRCFFVKDGELWHAALPPYCGDLHNDVRWKFKIPLRPLKSYNSYEGISEIRLLDKILYELEMRHAKGESCEKLNIVVIGDINREPLDDLVQMLNSIRESGANESKGYQEHSDYIAYADSSLMLHIYSLNTDHMESDRLSEEEKYPYVHYKFYPYKEQLKDPEKVDALLAQSDMLFILDSCDIYTGYDIASLIDVGTFWQRIASQDYEENYQRIQGTKNLARRGNLTDLRNVLTAFAWKGKTGILKKKENGRLLSFIEETCGKYNKAKIGKTKSVYVYVSDIDAFQGVYFNSKRFVRVERYNEKEIAIIRYSGFEESSLNVHNTNNNPKTIVFSLWQFVKYFSFILAKQLMPFDKMEKIYQLRDILVGVDYSNWPQRLIFTCHVPDYMKSCKTISFDMVREYLEQLVMPFFQSQGNDMYYEYFIRSINSFLYSDAKCLDDMLFLHLFTNQHSLLKDAYLKDDDDPELVVSKRRGGKYSQKRFYADIMKDYDTSSEMFSFKYSKLEDIQREGNLKREEIFQNIMEVCEQNQYGNSYLYDNCRKML